MSVNQLEYLRSLLFSWTEISSLLGVSRMTVYRRRAECGLLEEYRDVLSDAELDTLITDLRRYLPYSEQTVILGHLRSKGHHTTRARVQDSISRTDPQTVPPTYLPPNRPAEKGRAKGGWDGSILLAAVTK